MEQGICRGLYGGKVRKSELLQGNLTYHYTTGQYILLINNNLQSPTTWLQQKLRVWCAAHVVPVSLMPVTLTRLEPAGKTCFSRVGSRLLQRATRRGAPRGGSMRPRRTMRSARTPPSGHLRDCGRHSIELPALRTDNLAPRPCPHAHGNAHAFDEIYHSSNEIGEVRADETTPRMAKWVVKGNRSAAPRCSSSPAEGIRRCPSPSRT